MCKIQYHLLITANPLSDSKAAMTVFKTIKRLDVISREVNIFLPGFHTNDCSEADNSKETESKITAMKAHNNSHHEDYHGKEAVFHTYCESAGEMYFNDADFAHLMLDLEDRCPQFAYYGRTELVVLPACKGKIIYDEVTSYNLEPFFVPDSTSTLEEFLMSVLRLLQRSEQRESLEMTGILSGLYREMIHGQPVKETTDVVIRLDSMIMEHMKWKEADEVFFISYSTKDEYDAFALKALLEKNGRQVWIAPDGIPSGVDYACAIPAALRLTSRFVVLLSHHSARSSWVRKEIGKAISNDTRVDGIFLDDFNMENLKQYDHLDFMFENVQLRYTIKELFEDKQLLNDFITINK